MNDRREVVEIKQLLCDRILDVCAWLLPEGRRHQRVWKANNPVTADHGQTPELNVYVTGIVGSWKDYRSGDKGDVLNLIEYIKETDFRGALAQARDFLGLQKMSATERRASQDATRRRAQDSQEAARKKEDWKRKQAEKRWLSGFMDGAGSAAEAHALAYFREARGIDLAQIQHRDRTTLRYAAGIEYWSLAEWRFDKATGRRTKLKDGPQHPAIMGAMRTALGQFVDHHITFLDPRTPDKADFGPKKSPRLMSVPNAGGVMRISHGPEGLPPEEARQPHPLILAEGLETALSLALAIPEARVWACCSISGIRFAPVSFPFVAEVLIAGENDWDKPQAQQQLRSAVAELQASGKPLQLMFSHVGSDFNDLMKGD